MTAAPVTAHLTTTNAPVPRGPYVHARLHDDLVYVTGQIGRDPATGDFVPGGFAQEFHQAITNLQQILTELGSSLPQVIKAEVQFVDENDLDDMNSIYETRFSEPYPARTSYGVSFLWKGAAVQISCIATVAPQDVTP